jgi:hypothetical protein
MRWWGPAAEDENVQSLGDALRKALAKQSSKPTKKRASAVSAAFDAYSDAAEARLGEVDLLVSSGKASLQSPPGSILCTIRDSDTRNNSCACGSSPQSRSLWPVDSYGPASAKRAG